MKAFSGFARGADSLGRAVFGLLVPPLCVICEARLADGDKWVCARCGEAAAAGARPRSRSIPLDGGGSLAVSYALDYTPAVACLVREMKYGDKPGLGEFLAPFLWLATAGEMTAETALVPVPLHPARLRERGYNQSEILSRAIARRSGGAVFPRALRRTRNTAPQATLDRGERLRNVAGSLRPGPLSKLESKKVMLVDDVVTTGSTLRACAQALLDYGLEDLEACAIASRD